MVEFYPSRKVKTFSKCRCVWVHLGMERQQFLLSEAELKFASDAGMMLMKNILIGKVVQTYSLIAEDLKAVTAAYPSFTEEDLLSPKISRGEQYRGLPYVMLDYPRQFSREDVFAVRNMWWWGKGFSVMLHLKGKYQQKAAEKIMQKAGLPEEYFISHSDDEWDHDISGTGYACIKAIPKELLHKKLRKDVFLKIAIQYPLSEWNRANTLVPARFREIMEIIS